MIKEMTDVNIKAINSSLFHAAAATGTAHCSSSTAAFV
jgi:hypothetical protein